VRPAYQWEYVYGFVHPSTGDTNFWLMPSVNTPAFGGVLKDFADTVGAGPKKRIILVLDNAGWHKGLGLHIPEGIHLFYLPAYTPQLQPAERLWRIIDGPLVNKSFKNLAELDDLLAKRCCAVSEKYQFQIQGLTHFHWWPEKKIFLPQPENVLEFLATSNKIKNQNTQVDASASFTRTERSPPRPISPPSSSLSSVPLGDDFFDLT